MGLMHGSEPYTMGVARRALMGGTSKNPGAVATRLLGVKARRVGVTKRSKVSSPLHLKLRRRKATANPAPILAALGGLGGLGKISKRLKGPEARHAERVATFQEWARRALLGDAQGVQLLTDYIAGTGPKRARDAAALILAEVNQQLEEKEREEEREERELTAAERRRLEAGKERRETRFLSAGERVAGVVGQALARGFGRAPRRPFGAGGVGRAARAATSVGGIGAGATAAGAGAAATAAVVIGGLAVGALIGTLLRRQFGTARAVRAEEASVKANLALKTAREEFEAEKGRSVTRAEARLMFDAVEAHLRELGFQQKASGQWHRPRSAIERILG